MLISIQRNDPADGPIRKEEGGVLHSIWSRNGVVLGCAKTYTLISERQLKNVEMFALAECINIVAELKDHDRICVTQYYKRWLFGYY